MPRVVSAHDTADRRAAQLAAQQGQLAFQVRTVPADGPSGEWSVPAAVGSEGPIEPREKRQALSTSGSPMPA